MRNVAEFREMLRDAPNRDMTVREYAVQPTTLNDQARSIDATMATEAPTRVFDWKNYQVVREILLMTGQKFPEQLPLLDSHQRQSIKNQLGSTRNLRTENDKLVGTRFFSSTPDAQEAFTKVKEGHLRDGSIGYKVNNYVDIEPGAEAAVAGRKFKNDGQDTLRVTYDWSIFEDTITPIGADPGAKFRESPEHAAQRAANTQKEGPMTLDQLIAIYGEQHRALLAELHGKQASPADIAKKVIEAERAAATTEAKRATVDTTTKTESAKVEHTADEVTRAASEAIVAERKRIADIEGAAAKDIPQTMVRKAVHEGWAMERVNAEFLAEMRRNRKPGLNVEVGTDQADTIRSQLEDVVLFRGGVKVEAKRLKEINQFRGCSLQDIARLLCRAEGHDAPVDVDALLTRSLSTFSFPNLLGTTVNRILLGAYEESPSTIMQWAYMSEVNDFRQGNALKLGKFASVPQVGAGGEIESGSLTESKETFQAKSYGILFGISRRDFINDDLGAFTRVPQELGMAAKRNIDDIGYTLLISASGVGPTMGEDSIAMFSASHSDGSNYSATTTALTSAGMTTMKILMRKMKQTGVPLNIMPQFLLVPPELEQSALELVNSSQILISQAGSSDASTVRGNINVHAQTVVPIVEPRLSAGTNGTTAWYLIAPVAQAKSLQVSFLRGRQQPTIERHDPTNVLGIGWRMYHDVGVDAIDFRGIARSKNA